MAAASTKFQERALEKLHHSKRIHQRKCKSELAQLGVLDDGDIENDNYAGQEEHESFTVACERGDWRFVADVLKNDINLQVLVDNPLALHTACWHARTRVVKLLLSFAPKRYINERDLTGTAALTEICRSKCGAMTQRILVLKAMIDNGADISIQDKNGDTCLHWLARMGETTLCKTLFTASSRAFLLLDVRNSRGRTPLDVAEKFERNSSVSTFLRERQVMSFLPCRVFQKQEQIEAEKRKKFRLELELLAEALEYAHIRHEAATSLFNEQSVGAELERRKLEKDFIEAELSRATEQTQKWLKGPYGQNELKSLTKGIKRDLRDHLHKDETTKDADIAKEAKQKATEILLRKKQNEAKAKAISEFRSKNPPV